MVCRSFGGYLGPPGTQTSEVGGGISRTLVVPSEFWTDGSVFGTGWDQVESPDQTLNGVFKDQVWKSSTRESRTSCEDTGLSTYERRGGKRTGGERTRSFQHVE